MGMVHGAPVTYAAVPMVNQFVSQPVYNISPERFQLIMQGQPLTPEEIAALTGDAAVPTSMAVEAPATSVAEPLVEPDVPTDAKEEKKDKKSSKKKLSSAKKEKGCC